MSWWYEGKVTYLIQYLPMKTVDILQIGEKFLKLMSKLDLKRDDYRHIALYEEYMKMRGEGEKVDYIMVRLSDKYGLSESTIKRVIKRLSQEVRT